MVISKPKSTINNRKKNSGNGRSIRNSSMSKNYKALVHTNLEEKAKDNTREMKQEVWSKEICIPKEGIDAISSTIKTTKIMNKRIKRSLIN